jgi:hypothetical protein
MVADCSLEVRLVVSTFQEAVTAASQHQGQCLLCVSLG